MKRRQLFALLSFTSGLALTPSVTLAQDGIDPYTSLNVHVAVPDFTMSPCVTSDIDDAAADCSDISHDPIAGQAALQIVAHRACWTDEDPAYGLTGLEFGISYEGLSLDSWLLCVDGLELPQNDDNGVWPESNTGNAVAWFDCFLPVGQNVLVGMFLVTDASSGQLSIVEDPRKPGGGADRGLLVDCNLFTWEFYALGGVDLDSPASSPTCVAGTTCGSTPSRVSSWGQIKSAFGVSTDD